MKKQTVRCTRCNATYTTRKTPHYCSCTNPPTRCTPASIDRFVDRVIGSTPQSSR